ncbi:hypothetical protein GCM10023196_010850 [Actinoallomurus vinaceus]|uniref:Uncharacterized protein n=1 Tax=Actinoallomurus vinaceus TaxID=1080074 RepID=A0ABP8U4L8_9ACTN
MGVMEDIQARVTNLERRMDEHDTVHVLVAGQVELRQMVAKLLAQSEADGRS